MLGQSKVETAPYRGVGVVIGDANLRLAEAMQQTLRDRGLSEVAICGDATGLRPQLDQRFVDLLVLDHVLPGIDLVEVVQQIRRQALGRNPFVTIIATIGRTDAGSTKAAVDAGVDDIIAKPLTVERLFASVTALTQAQRSFVVSPDYVGPTRRKAPRPDDARAKMRDVPNTLHSRMLELAGDREVQRMVARAAALISDDRFEAAIAEIDRLVTRIVGHFKTRGSHDTLDKDLRRLIEVSEAWRQHYHGPSRNVVFDLGGMLITLARRVAASPPGRSETELHLLAQLNQAVRSAIDVDHREAKHFAEITQMVTQFTSQAPARR